MQYKSKISIRNIKVVQHNVKFKKPVIYGGDNKAQTRNIFQGLMEQKPEILGHF